MSERRAVFQFGVTYQTSKAKLEQIPTEVKRIVESLAPLTRFDRAHFKAFGVSSMDFEVVYWVLNPDFNVFMDLQQKINLALVEYFEQESIEFAYPSQTLYIPSMQKLAENVASLRARSSAEESSTV